MIKTTLLIIAIGIIITSFTQSAHSTTNPLIFSVYTYSAHIQPRVFEPLNIIVSVNNSQSVGYWYRLRLFFYRTADPSDCYDITCTHYVEPKTPIKEETFTVVPWTTGQFEYRVILTILDDPYSGIEAKGTVNVVSGSYDEILNQLNQTLSNQGSKLDEVNARIHELELLNMTLQMRISELQTKINELSNTLHQYLYFFSSLIIIIAVAIGSVALHKSIIRQRKKFDLL
jgi:hypothetical protein